MRPAIAADLGGLAWADIVAEGQSRQGAAHAQKPCRLGRGGQRPADTEARRDREAVADIALAIAQHLVVDGQHERVVIGGLAPARPFRGEAAIPVDEHLHPARRGARRCDVLQRAGRAMAGAVERAGGGRGARRCAFAVRPEQPGQSGRRDAERHGQRAAEQRDGEVAHRSAVQRARQQRDIVERLFVAAQACARPRRRHRRNRTPARAARGARQPASRRRCRAASARVGAAYGVAVTGGPRPAICPK